MLITIAPFCGMMLSSYAGHRLVCLSSSDAHCEQQKRSHKEAQRGVAMHCGKVAAD
jgi:hypothetical protein